MVDERTRVIARLLEELASRGIDPDEPWSATWDPTERVWTFASEAVSSSSSSAGGARGAKIQTR